MTAYKLVTIDAPYWGFGSRLEQALLAGERAIFLESHRNCFSWIDEWFGLTLDVMRELEKQSDSSLN
ncbi:phosphatidylinositol transfer protein 2 [Phtheirospermum japonicum]|uniref:Phosphatidylinositol transfer protein 2 n=1 Tax=Phtheirospermum japonicum TaxID=374723 RepID=A0A830CD66_9LAMI|nr:phosphatidylinositol transfer protein 2 [Phtheirospermum japonicum]